MKNRDRNILGLLLFYSTIFYTIPVIALWYFRTSINDYKIPNGYFIESQLIISILLVIIFSLYSMLPLIRFQVPRNLIIFKSKLNLIFIIAFMFSSIIFFKDYGISFRHQGEGIATNMILILHSITKEYFKIFILYKALLEINGLPNNTNKIQLFLVLGCFLLSLSGSLDILYILVISALIINPSLLRKNLKNQASVIFLTGTSLFLVLALGLGNKVGFDNFFDFISNNFQSIGVGLIARFSTMQISLMNSIEYSSSFEVIEILTRELQVGSDNLQILFGGNKGLRVDPWSINRYNFLKISNVFLPRTGTSPGLFSTFLIAPLLALPTILIFSFFLKQFSRIIPYKLNIYGFLIIFTMIFYPLTMNLYGNLNFISPQVMYLVGVTYCIYALPHPKNIQG